MDREKSSSNGVHNESQDRSCSTRDLIMQSGVPLPPNVIDRNNQAKLPNGREETLAPGLGNHVINSVLPKNGCRLQSTFS